MDFFRTTYDVYGELFWRIEAFVYQNPSKTTEIITEQIMDFAQ